MLWLLGALLCLAALGLLFLAGSFIISILVVGLVPILEAVVWVGTSLVASARHLRLRVRAWQANRT
jgi:hypothetical protein